MNLSYNNGSSYLIVQRKLINKYKDVKLLIQCMDEHLEFISSRLFLANFSPYFEKVFELETFKIDEDGLRVYKLEVPFSKQSVSESLQILYKDIILSSVCVAFENILTLNYFNVPEEMLNYLVSNIIIQFENMKKEEKEYSLDYINEFYSIIDEYSIFPGIQTQNLKQRLEHLTCFKNEQTILFEEGLFVVEEDKKWIFKFNLSNGKFLSEKLEFPIRDCLVKLVCKQFANNLPDKHILLGISARPFSENYELSLDECLDLQKSKQEVFLNAKVSFDVYNGLDDPVISATLVNSSYAKNVNVSVQTLPTPVDPVMNSRQIIGCCYPKDKINAMTYVFVNIEILSS